MIWITRWLANAAWMSIAMSPLFLTLSAAMSQEWTASGPVEANPNGAYKATTDAPVVLQLNDAGADDYILTGQLLMFGEQASAQIGLGKANLKLAARNPSAATIKKQNAEAPLTFNGSRSALPRLNDLWLDFSLRAIGDKAELQLMLPDFTAAPFAAAPLSVPADRRSPGIVLQRAAVRNLSIKAFSDLSPLMLPMTIDHAVNAGLAGDQADAALNVKIDPASLPRGLKVIDGVPFCFADSAAMQAIDVAKLRKMAHKTSKEEPPRAYADSGYSLQAPGDQYSAVHLIAFSSRRPETAPRVNVRLGFVNRTADEWVNQTADVPHLDDADAQGAAARGAEAPRNGSPGRVVSSLPIQLMDGAKGYLHHIRVPMPQSGQLREFDSLVVQFTRQVEIKPDEFLRRSVDPESGVVILAVAMERTPVEFSYAADEKCNLFNEGHSVVFRAKLANRSGKRSEVVVSAHASGPGLPKEQNPNWAEWNVEQRVVLDPGQSREATLDLTPKARGWFACTIDMQVDGRLEQTRESSFACIAPDTRLARDDSPFGIWCYWSGHAVTTDPDRTEKFYNIINKGGWRWTLSGPGAQYPPPKGTTTAEQAEIHRYQLEKYKFKVTFAKPPTCQPPESVGAGYRGLTYDAENFKTKVVPWLEWPRSIGMDNAFFILHESRFDGDAILTHFNELLGGTPYPWKPETKALFDQQVQQVTEYCRALKQAAPDSKVVLLNDGASYALEYLKAGFPADAFDVLGLEAYGYHHLPEAQPDWLTVLGDLYTAKLAQAKYGYRKPIWLNEALYHSTRPGAMWLHEQGVITVRDAMLCLAYGVERMTCSNTAANCANSYGKSIWGSAGVCFREPEYNPKISFAMFAWLTQVLDQARYAGKLKHDSTSLHVLDFQKPDGSHVYPLWVVGGKQRVALEVQDEKAVVYDTYGNAHPAASTPGRLVVEVSDAPIYVTGTVVGRVIEHPGIEIPAPSGQAVAGFASAGQIKALDPSEKWPNRQGVTPLLSGRYRAGMADVDGRQALEIALLDDDDPRKLLPRYGEIVLAQPIALPGRPFALNFRAKGNGGWGKLALELTDAKGRKFMSLSDGPAAYRGLSYFTFDGWQTMSIPLPGRFLADKSMSWPGSGDWHNTSEVTYPLSLTKIIMVARPHIIYIDEERDIANRSVYLESMSVTPAPEGM